MSGSASKRILDLTLAVPGLIVLTPLIFTLAAAVWLQDFRSPFYCSKRIGRNGIPFILYKLRSMKIDADRSGIDSTAADDQRITPLGHFIRRFKIDELPQLLNVILGNMSLVGPRPNVERDVAIYTSEERRLLDVRPGITDISSVVFADEAQILEGKSDPNLSYNQLIRPWKSRLGLLYVEHSGFLLDMRLIGITILALVSRPRALRSIQILLASLGATPDLRQVAQRDRELVPYPPPGADSIVLSRVITSIKLGNH